jgi:hypothetical protein
VWFRKVVTEDTSGTCCVLVLRRVTLSLGCDDEEKKCGAMPVRVIAELWRGINFKAMLVDGFSRRCVTVGHLSASLDAILFGGPHASVLGLIRRTLKKFLSGPSAC